MMSDNKYSMSGLLFGVVVGLIIICLAVLSMCAGNENVEPYRIGKGGDSPFNSFEAYTFRHNQHRCFVVVKMDGNIDLDCP